MKRQWFNWNTIQNLVECKLIGWWIRVELQLRNRDRNIKSKLYLYKDISYESSKNLAKKR